MFKHDFALVLGVDELQEIIQAHIVKSYPQWVVTGVSYDPDNEDYTVNIEPKQTAVKK